VVDFEQFLNISSVIGYFLGKYRIGFSNRTRARHKLYNYVKPCSTKVHMVNQFYGLCEVLGLPKKEPKLENFDFISEGKKVDSFLKERGVSNKIIIGIHAASSENAEAKRWPRNHFIKLINLLNKRFDNLMFVMTGIESEGNYVNPIINNVEKGNCYNSCGVFNLKDFIYFTKKCGLFISNDTGPIHIAAARGITCVGLYGPTSPLVYGPYGKKHIILYKKPGCGPCVNNYSSKSTNCKDPICMKNITPKEVSEVIVNYINKI
jgi:ADP-heptose:LPS heptosyltransferase